MESGEGGRMIDYTDKDIKFIVHSSLHQLGAIEGACKTMISALKYNCPDEHTMLAAMEAILHSIQKLSNQLEPIVEVKK